MINVYFLSKYYYIINTYLMRIKKLLQKIINSGRCVWVALSDGQFQKHFKRPRSTKFVTYMGGMESKNSPTFQL